MKRLFFFGAFLLLVSVGCTTATKQPAVVSPPPRSDTIFLLWHLADVYYGMKDDDNFATMVRDMNTIPWDMALVAGDISENGSTNNLTTFQTIFSENTTHPWDHVNILAGNHEYQCPSSSRMGCLDHYQTIIKQPLRYTKDVGNIHFIILSTDDGPETMSDEAMDWLEQEISTNQDKIVIIATHQMPHLFPRAQAILDRYGVDAWLFGHAHCKHGNAACDRHGARGDFYREAETTFVDAGYIGHMESRYIMFTEGSGNIHIRSRNHLDGRFQEAFEHTAPLRFSFDR